MLRSRSEENGGISSLNSVVLSWWLVIWGRLNLLNITNGESLEEILANSLLLGGLIGSREIGLSLNWLWDWFWSWLGDWLLMNFMGLLFFGCGLWGSLLLLSTECSL